MPSIRRRLRADSTGGAAMTNGPMPPTVLGPMLRRWITVRGPRALRSQKGPLRGASPMTIINSIVSDHGLIQASDSNLTGPGSPYASPGKKVFRLDFTEGALGLAGTYSVGTQLMDTWMPSCISAYASTDSPTQEGFAYYLKERLETDLTDSQWRDGGTDPNSGVRERRRRRASSAAFRAQLFVYQPFDRCIRRHTTDVRSLGRLLEAGLPSRQTCRTPSSGLVSQLLQWNARWSHHLLQFRAAVPALPG